jgi:hypothetical protein
MVDVEVCDLEEAWLRGFTTAHPDLLVEVHNLVHVPRHKVLGDFEIVSPAMDRMAEIASFPDVVEVGHLDVPPQAGRYRVLFHETVLISLIVKLRILLRYPTRVRNGLVDFETVDRMVRIRRILAVLRKSGYDPRIVSLRRDPLKSRRVNLTRVQREMLRQAVQHGYFHVPRRITLTGLARKLSRSKSTVSQTLAVVEEKLVEAASEFIA